jgi:SAM-dependent methyltransferase
MLDTTLQQVYHFTGSTGVTSFLRLLPWQLREDPCTYGRAFQLIKHTHAEDPPVAIYLPDCNDAPDIYELLNVLSSEHYRAKIYTNMSSNLWGDEGNVEVWPTSFIGYEPAEVLIVAKDEHLNQAKALGCVSYFDVVLCDQLLESPRDILAMIYPSWDLRLLEDWHDRFAARRQGKDYQLGDDITRIKYITDKLRELQPASVAEVGCWCGDFTYRFLEFPFIQEIECIDVCRASLNHAADRIDALLRKPEHAENTQEFRYRKGWAESIPLPDKSVDMIVIAEVLEHVIDLDKALAECRRVARKWIVGSVPNYIETNIGHARIFNPEQDLLLKPGETLTTTPYTDVNPQFGGWNFLWTLPH